MTIFLKLPTIIGPMVLALVTLGITIVLFFVAHRLYGGRRPTETLKFVQQMAMRVGTMHALVVALVFSVLTGQLIKLQDTSDMEAMSAANIYFILVGHPSEAAEQLRSMVPKYLRTVIQQDWKELKGVPHDLPAWRLIGRMQKITLDWQPATPTDEMIRNYVFTNLNTMAENRNKRVIERQAPALPPIFWVIAVLGYLLTLVPYMCIELNRLRLFLVSCYAVIIGVLFYGIAVLDNPFQGQALKPSSFQVMYLDIATHKASVDLGIK